MNYRQNRLKNDEPTVCAYCNRPINIGSAAIEHLVPESMRSFAEPEPGNLLFACAECNSLVPRDIQFIRYLSALMERHPEFHDIENDGLVGDDVRYRADIATFRGRKRAQKRLIIKCKSFAEFTPSRVRTTLDQLRLFEAVGDDVQLVLAFPGMLDDSSSTLFKEANIEVWDALRIFDTFEVQIADLSDPTFQKVFLEIRDRVSIEQRLIRRLENCPAGADNWIEYQNLIGVILKHLFSPPLMEPLVEHSDATKVNRRDFIFPNYADDKFWQFLRHRYSADYIVVDAKNHSKRVKKDHVSQLANYLKGAGVGKFGVIACRNGPDKGAAITAREQWLIYGKLVIFVTSHDLERMLLAKAAQGDPTKILTDIIQDFRLSI
ncbi:hypothetical protein FHT80_000058 [Rhizobium sp. BK226]|uniref:HNH endonuclease n=1 Tax=Rhizobium TaxID=379 RepID=UPI00161CE72A|nr:MULTISPECIES: hypothetical protein [Rhizobium]MBB4110755.1 hypothetical protein [Rhizobium sp. BK226]UTS89582.1 HNH endonuclease [Rhizobium anhuiense bv. trifolii]